VEATYGTYLMALIVAVLAFGFLYWAFSMYSSMTANVLATAANQLNATQGPYASSASQTAAAAHWILALFSNPFTLAALIALGFLLSAYGARRY